MLGPAAGACGAVCSRSVAAAMVVGGRMLRLWCKSCRERERECGLEVLDGGTWRYGFGVGRAKQLGGRRLQNAALASVTPAQPVGGAGRGLVAAVSAAHEGRRRGRHLWQCRRRGLQRAGAAPAESARPIGTPAGGCLGGARRSLGSPEGGQLGTCKARGAHGPFANQEPMVFPKEITASGQGVIPGSHFPEQL